MCSHVKVFFPQHCKVNKVEYAGNEHVACKIPKGHHIVGVKKRLGIKHTQLGKKLLSGDGHG